MQNELVYACLTLVQFLARVTFSCLARQKTFLCCSWDFKSKYQKLENLLL